MRGKNLIGKRFERLTVIERVSSPLNRKGKCIDWLCVCDCGKQKVLSSEVLTHGKSKSCGCLLREISKRRNYKHGETKTHLYSIWSGMRERCYKEKCASYEHYGKRGIRVCDEWNGNNGYVNFAKWAKENGYSDNLSRWEQSIDRIDVNKDYSPDNCRWVTNTVQQNNKRTNYRITVKGETHTIAEWSRIKGFSNSTIANRLRRGMSDENAVETPLLRLHKRKAKVTDQIIESEVT